MASYEVSHFFLGRVSKLSNYNDFIEEYYGDDDDAPLSKFCESQGEYYIDHDFMEVGEREEEPSLAAFFKSYSYSESWSAGVLEEALSLNLEDANVLIFITKDQIEKPRSVKGDGFEIVYIGEFGYPI